MMNTNETTPWLAELRTRARAHFQSLGFPTPKLERWKHINLEPIIATPFIPASPADASQVTSDLLRPHLIGDGSAPRLVAVNGCFASHLSTTGKLPPGITFQNVAATLDRIRIPLTRSDDTTNAFAALNTCSFTDGFFVDVPAGTVVAGLLQLMLVSVGQRAPTTSHPRIVISVGRGASVDLALTVVGWGTERTFMNTVIDVDVAPEATLNFVHLQRAEKNAIHFTSANFRQQAKSQVQILHAMQGGALTRNETHVFLAGEEASCIMKGVSLLTDDAQAYHHAHVEHVVPRCFSRQLYKNILNGNARSEFDSLAFIHAAAQLSDSHQLNRNIVLSGTARAITRPQLKVFADNVKAAHGATVGQLDEQELFYLRSRGLSEALARSTLMYGFAEEVIQEISSPTIKTHLEQFVVEELQRVAKIDGAISS